MLSNLVKQQNKIPEMDVALPRLKRRKLSQAPQKMALFASLSPLTKQENCQDNGETLIPTADRLSWSPSPSAKCPGDGPLTFELKRFHVSDGNNTVVIKFNAPEGSRRFSINLAGSNHDNFGSILFHLNPRHFERGGQVVMNNKYRGTWGQAINVPLSTIPVIFGQASCTLSIQITQQGFDVFLNNKHIVHMPHRLRLASTKSSLFLNLPATDDYGKPEKWTVSGVWWGKKVPMATGDTSNVAGGEPLDLYHSKKLFIRKLPKLKTDSQVELRKAELERAFWKYAGPRGVTVIAPKHKSFAFFEFERAREAFAALQALKGCYSLSRAKYTREEALEARRPSRQTVISGRNSPK